MQTVFKALLGYSGLYLNIVGHIRLYWGVEGYACLDILGYSVVTRAILDWAIEGYTASAAAAIAIEAKVWLSQ